MKFYFLVEGAQTEKRLYRAWVRHCFPRFRQVDSLLDLGAESFFIISGKGYPSYLTRISEALQNAAAYRVDHLFICIDAEELSYASRFAEIQERVDAAQGELQTKGILFLGQIHIIVADCCVESWLLGHRKLAPRSPASKTLRAYLNFYDVSASDPERMPAPPEFRTRQDFHLEYLREIFRHHGRTYTKERPGIAEEASYLDALRERCSTSGDLKSFGELWRTWHSLGAQLPSGGVQATGE